MSKEYCFLSEPMSTLYKSYTLILYSTAWNNIFYGCLVLGNNWGLENYTRTTLIDQLVICYWHYLWNSHTQTMLGVGQNLLNCLPVSHHMVSCTLAQIRSHTLCECVIIISATMNAIVSRTFYIMNIHTPSTCDPHNMLLYY